MGGAQGAERLRLTVRFERLTFKAPGFAGGYLLANFEPQLARAEFENPATLQNEPSETARPTGYTVAFLVLTRGTNYEYSFKHTFSRRGGGGSPRRLIFAVVGITTAMTLALLAGCTGSAGIRTGVSQKQGAYAEVYVGIKWDPPGQELANFNAAQAWARFSLINQAITNATGMFTVTVTDTNGNTLGAKSFSYYISNNKAYASDPSVVHQWLQQFRTQTAVDADVSIRDIKVSPTTSANTIARITTEALYQSVNHVSASTSMAIRGGSYVCETYGCKHTKLK